MKHVAFIFGLIVFTTGLTAQVVEERPVVMSEGERNAFVIDLPKRDIQDIEKIWSKYVRDIKARVKDRDGEWFCDDAEMPEISDNTVDVYATFYDKSAVVEMIAWVDMGGVYMNSQMHPGAVNYFAAWLSNFRDQVQYEMVEEKIELEEEIMEDLGKELDDLIKKEEDYMEDIAKYQEKIAEAQLAVDQIRAEQAAIRAQIQKQEEKLSTARKKYEKL